MDLIACICKLRPDVTWRNNIVNAYNLETISETYQSVDPIPTMQECIDVFPDVEADILLEKQKKEEYTQESADVKGKTLSQKEQWVKNRLGETTFDTTSKIAIGKIFRKLLAFTD